MYNPYKEKYLRVLKFKNNFNMKCNKMCDDI